MLYGVCITASGAHSIGINFNASNAADVDFVTGTAGALPQANWNNTQGRPGTIAAGSLIDESGTAVAGMSVAWQADAAYSVGNYDGTGEGDDTALMHGGLESQKNTFTNSNEIILSGIPYARYDIYVYVNGWNTANRDGEVQLNVNGAAVAASQRPFDPIGVDFIDGTHSHSESTGAEVDSTYVRWRNLTAGEIGVQMRKTQGNILITGIQVVEVALPADSSQNIGINFNASTPAYVDLVSGTAGAVPQGNWNNTSNNIGALGSVREAGGAVLDGISVIWQADAAWSVGNNNGTGEGDDTALMHGGLESQDAAYTGDTKISLSGIPYATYDIYLYVNSWDANERDGEAQLLTNGVVVADSARSFDPMGTAFIDGTHTHSESTGWDDVGTYVRWKNRSSANTTIQLRTKVAGPSSNTMVTGLQIVKSSYQQGTTIIIL